MRRLLTLLAAISLSGGAVAAESIAKISVLANGQVRLYDAPTTLPELDAALAELKAAGGVVRYYREVAAAEPPAAAIETIKLVVKHQLPISMSTKPDFSDVVGPDGTSRPRPNNSLERSRER